ncbi:tripartite tricarboxylate transporter substrate binding protein [Roseomonas sp. SSH11]|uniref:Tripartite tricarboxylate transporter substrate binding protein n=1 Tax=Pararoseomonas baculiformis TaxID=2820812 RepID=A0ABS4ALH0_9PROT|nr:tripartite tricarboxylate transporter substrate-binding protein [Pararoseomonas baculiformis]MBP0447353.1 tripartite tricarboxylate transporter substrate binding protein [Pararoseomonas baculiformis]
MRDATISPYPALGRRKLLAGLAGGVTMLGACPVSSQSLGSRPVVVVVPFAPGGAVDIVARALAEPFSAALGRTVVIENRPGASGAIAAASVSRAEPDGHTLFIATPGTSITAAFQPQLLPGDPRQILAPVGRLATQTYVLTVSKSHSVKNFAEFVAWTKAHPGEFMLANTGQLTATRLAGELLGLRLGTEITPVPYRGSGPAATDIASGRVHGIFAQLSDALAMQRQGAKLVAVSAKDRSRLLPDVPAIAETLPGFDVFSWNGIFAPAATPVPILNEVNAALNKAISEETFRARFRADGVEFVPGPRQALADILDREIKGWTDLSTKVRIDPQ